MQTRIYTGEKRRGIGRGTALLALTACLFVPALAQAQDKDPGAGGSSAKTGAGAGLADKRVSLDAETMRLTEALPPMMKSVGADFVVDNSLKNTTVSVHLNNVRFQVAVDTLLKVCSEPVTYKIEDGVYHFIPRVDPPEPPRDAPLPAWSQGPSYKLGKIVVQNGDAQELVDFLTGNSDGVTPAPSSLSINGSVSGFRSYSNSGFVNGRPYGDSYSSPITGDNNYGFGNQFNSNATRSGSSSVSFGPFGYSPGGGFSVGGHRIGGGNRGR